MPIGAPLLLLPWGGPARSPSAPRLYQVATSQSCRHGWIAPGPARRLRRQLHRQHAVPRNSSSPSSSTSAGSDHQHRKPTNAVSMKAGPAHSAFGGSREVQLADAARAARERTPGGAACSGAAALLGGASLG